MINVIELSSLVRKQLKKLPGHIVVSFQNWVEDVETRGLEEVRKIPGYHDEPLRGELKGTRSIRLSKSRVLPNYQWFGSLCERGKD